MPPMLEPLLFFFFFLKQVESCPFTRYDIPNISLMICVVLITLLQDHLACSPCRIHRDKNTDALLVCSPTLCTESSHNIVKYTKKPADWFMASQVVLQSWQIGVCPQIELMLTNTPCCKNKNRREVSCSILLLYCYCLCRTVGFMCFYLFCNLDIHITLYA